MRFRRSLRFVPSNCIGLVGSGTGLDESALRARRRWELKRR